MTASGGNFVGSEVSRNKRSPQWGAASIEAAEESRRAHPQGHRFLHFPPGSLKKETENRSLSPKVLTFLGLIGVIVDHTTAEIGDSERAMGYDEPWDDIME